MAREVNKVILEVRAGAGGDEASLFAGDLVRMYQKYAIKKRWKWDALDVSASELRGYKTYVAQVSGEGVYDALQYESGVHRVQRIPETEKSGRVHTSTASVAVLPEVEAREVEIKESDLEVSFARSGGAGGQNVNKLETKVRIRHIPTGVVVTCEAGRGQHGNREKAMQMLRAKLYEAQHSAQSAEVAEERREQIGTADRSEKIRTYNFPQDRITDHRIKKKWNRIENILNGDLEPVVKAFRKADKK
jgi:peptide chain release factor 1